MFKKILLFAVVLSFFACSDDDKEEEIDLVDEDQEVEIVEQSQLNLGMGWNLGNQMDANDGTTPNETCWGNGACSQATMDALKSAGFQTVRIPVTWLNKVTKNSDGSYSIDETWLNRVAEIVGYCENAGLNAIVNIHHDGSASDTTTGPEHWLDILNASKDESVNEEVEAQLSAMWTIIAEKFKDKGDFLMFEAFNEIHDGGWAWGENRTDGGKQYAILNEWLQVFVDAVRSTGGNNATRWLGCPSYCTNIDRALDDSFVLPNDDYLMVAVHFYDPNDMCLNGTKTSWGHNSEYSSTNGFKETYVTNYFKKLYDKFVANDIPVYIGEMGCTKLSMDDSVEAWRLYYLEYVVKAAKDYGLFPIYWDNGQEGYGAENFGIIRHSDGSYVNNGEAVATTMTNAMNNDDDDYTLDSVYNSSPTN